MSEALWEIPDSWAWTNLEVVADWSSGGTPRSTEPKFYGGTIPWLTIGDLTEGVVRDSAKSITNLGLENSSAKIVKPGALLIAMYGSIGKLGIAGIECSTNQAIAFTEQVRAEVETKYLFYYLLRARANLNETGKGGTQQNISQTVLKAFPICLPSLSEQRRIVAKLETLLSRVDAAQARLATIPRILKRFRESVLAAACSGKLTADWRVEKPAEESAFTLLERIRKQRRTLRRFGDAEADSETNGLPVSWLVVEIEELTSIQNGRAFPSKQYGQSGVRLLRPGNLHINGQVEWSEKNTACLPKQWSKDYPEFLLGTGELLMNLTAQSLKDEFLGRVCIKTDGVPALLNQRIARFVSHGTDDLRPYLFVYFKSPRFRSYVNTLHTGSLIRHMHSKQVLSHVAPLPPLAEQQEIVRRVEALFKIADALDERYRKAKAHVDKLTQSILAKAFRGELVPQDPNDEPASVLLERIKQKRMPSKSQPTKRRAFSGKPL